MEIDQGQPPLFGKPMSYTLDATAIFMMLIVWFVRLRWFSSRNNTSVLAEKAYFYRIVPALWSTS